MIEDKDLVVATKACAECRARRRKCDRSIPCCTLCDRLGRTCLYEASTRSYALPRLRGSQSQSQEREKGTGREISISKPVCEFNEKSNDVSRIYHSIDSLPIHIDIPIPIFVDNINNTTQIITSLLGPKINTLQSLASKYFSTIHLWFPILSEDAFLLHLESVYMNPRAGFSLLVLAVAVVVWVPSDSEEEGEGVTPLYRVLKREIGGVEADCCDESDGSSMNGNAGFSMEVLQARLLCALFETGHGLLGQAFLSLGGCERVFEGLVKEGEDEEEMLRVKWGIVILDRFNTLLRGGGKDVSRSIKSPDTLPKDRNILDQTFLDCLDPLSLSAPANIKIGPFARQAQVSHVLEILLLYLNDSSTHTEEESNQLIKTLTAFTFLLPEESANPWPQYCGAMGLCISSLMTLHSSLPRRDNEDTILLPQEVTLEYSLTRISQFAHSFNTKAGWVDPEGISPFAPLGVAIAAKMMWERWIEGGREVDLEGARELYLMLGIFGRRWRGVGKFIRSLEGLEGLGGLDGLKALGGLDRWGGLDGLNSLDDGLDGLDGLDEIGEVWIDGCQV